MDPSVGPVAKVTLPSLSVLLTLVIVFRQN